MVEFLTTAGISYNLEELIKNSEEKLFLVSPYLQIADSLKHLITERNLQKIDIRVIYRKDTKINAEDMSFLQELNSVKTLTPYHFREYVQPKPLIQIPNLLWNLSYHTTIPQIDMIDLAILK